MRRQTHMVRPYKYYRAPGWLEIEAALSSGCYPNRAVLNPGKYSRNSKALLRIRQPDSNIASTAYVLLIALSFIRTPINYRSTVCNPASSNHTHGSIVRAFPRLFSTGSFASGSFLIEPSSMGRV